MFRYAIGRILGAVWVLSSLAACVQLPKGGPDEVARVERELRRIAPKAPAAETRRLAEVSVRTGAELAQRYGVAVGPWLHNTMVNAGLRDRGLCWQWAQDMTRALAAAQPQAFELHWGKANGGRLNEHNTVVLTARGRPFEEGVVLDPWRLSGAIFAKRVQEDRKYRWEKKDPPAGT